MPHSWLTEHLETFVKPRLGAIPFSCTNRDAMVPFFTANEMTVIKNSWKAIKKAANGRTITLPGRDVFIYEVLARRENYPTVFIPNCSRQSVRKVDVGDPSKVYLFDTGFIGSIPMALGVQNFTLLSISDRRKSIEKQVFPHLTSSRSLALKIESTPKYWQSARILDGNIIQAFSDDSEFARAAQLTVEIYTNSSPRFIGTPKPIGGGRFSVGYDFPF